SGRSCSPAWGSPCSIADRRRVTSLIGSTRGSIIQGSDDEGGGSPWSRCASDRGNRPAALRPLETAAEYTTGLAASPGPPRHPARRLARIIQSLRRAAAGRGPPARGSGHLGRDRPCGVEWADGQQPGVAGELTRRQIDHEWGVEEVEAL